MQIAFRPEALTRWLAQKRKEGLDVASLWSVLSVEISHALKRGRLAEDPRKRLSDELPRRIAKSASRCLTDEECSSLIASALPSSRDLVAFYAETGTRQSEGLGVTLWLAGTYVFSTAEGNPLIHRNVSRDLFDEGGAADRAGLNREGLPRLSCHDLRHTAISRWIAAGLDPVTVARMAGDDLKTILDTYAHEFEKSKRRTQIREQLAAGTGIRLSGSDS